MSDAPLYERDPAAWAKHLADGNAAQARKRVSADALVRDAAGRILIVDPTYKPGWDLPGGMAEANEAPDNALRRELREELGIDLTVGRLLCVDWVPPHGPWDDLLAFEFDGGTLTPDQVDELRVVDDEIAEFAFCAVDQLDGVLPERLARRVQCALDVLVGSDPAVYLADGRLPGARLL